MEKLTKLRRISAGMTIPEALHWFCEGCLSSWNLLSKQEQSAHLRELRRLLSDPLTDEQATALRSIGEGEQSMEEVIDWLRHAPMPRGEHRGRMIQRELSALGPIPAMPKQGYRLEFGAGRRFQHRFCGRHLVESAGCPNCAKPMLRLLSLDTRDPRLALVRPPFPSLDLFYCWTCNIQTDTLIYRIEESGGIELLYYGRGGASREQPYPEYPLYFPESRVELVPLTQREQDMVRIFNRSTAILPADEEYHLVDPRHQIGGEPYLLHPASDVLCQICSEPMPLFAAICDNAADSAARPGYSEVTSFTLNPEIQTLFHYCRRCFVVGAYNVRGWDGSLEDLARQNRPTLT